MRSYLPLILFAIALLPGIAHAHGMDVTASVDETGVLTIVATYSGGHPVVDGTITVNTADGEQLFSGKTDADGSATFTITCRTTMEIAVRQGSHRGRTTVKKNEIPDTLPDCPVQQ